MVKANEESKPGCPGRGGGPLPPTGEYRPTIPIADPGTLCIYVDLVENAVVESGTRVPVYEEGWFAGGGALQTGTFIDARCTNEECVVMGTWAVTAPPE